MMGLASLRIILDGEGAWGDLKDKKIINATGDIQVAALERGMTSGKPSVAFRVDLEDGRVVFAETSLALFLAAADVFKAKHGDPRE